VIGRANFQVDLLSTTTGDISGVAVARIAGVKLGVGG
jgi:hypothetical protein